MYSYLHLKFQSIRKNKQYLIIYIKIGNKYLYESRNTYFPVSSLFSNQLNLSDFGFEKPALKKIKEINKDIITVKIHQTSNKEIHNNVKSILSVIKRIFNRTKRSRSLQLSNKETKLKNTIYNIYRLI